MGERIECHCCDSEETVEDWKRKRVREEKKSMKKGITARKLAYAKHARSYISQLACSARFAEVNARHDDDRFNCEICIR
jgi:hypothetical protein